MARKNKSEKIADLKQGSQYLQRLLEDEELRSGLSSAYESARNAYGRVSNGKSVGALLDDGKLHREIKDTAAALIDIASVVPAAAAAEAPKRKGARKPVGRSLLLLTVTAVLAVALSEGLRSKVLDMMFGAEEEFDYSSSTTPATPAPEAVAGG